MQLSPAYVYELAASSPCEMTLYALVSVYVATSLTIPYWVPIVKAYLGQTGVYWVFATLTYYAYLAWLIFAALLAYMLLRVPLADGREHRRALVERISVLRHLLAQQLQPRAARALLGAQRRHVLLVHTHARLLLREHLLRLGKLRAEQPLLQILGLQLGRLVLLALLSKSLFMLLRAEGEHHIVLLLRPHCRVQLCLLERLHRHVERGR